MSKFYQDEKNPYPDLEKKEEPNPYVSQGSNSPIQGSKASRISSTDIRRSKIRDRPFSSKKQS
jgi:hypothetical protein